MKRLKLFFVACLVLVAAANVNAQNIQVHYDFGRAFYKDLSLRSVLTTTVEKFHPDAWGSTFFFVDMDYTSNGISTAYWEIARELKFWDGPFSAHLEYNGGLSSSSSFNNNYLLGATYSYNSADFSKGFTLSAMYKHIAKASEPHSAQVTGTWYMNMKGGLYTFSGFVDLWRENNKVIFLTEPQFWVNLNKLSGVNEKFNLSIGTEVELSKNFIYGSDKFHAIPTLALKWTIN